MLSIPPEIINFFKKTNRILLVKGKPGTGKTIFSLTLLKEFSKADHTCFYISTRVEPADLVSDLPWIKDFLFPSNIIDAVSSKLPRVAPQQKEKIAYETLLYSSRGEVFSGIVKLITAAKKPFVVIDSIDAIKESLGLSDISDIELLLYELSKKAKANIVLISEGAKPTRLDYVVDGVVLLRDLHNKREMVIEKIRGVSRNVRSYSFTLRNGVFQYFPPVSHLKRPIPPDDKLFREIISSGSKDLDKLLGGGIPRGASVLVVGPIGSGKTTIGLQFIYEGLKQGENALLLSFEETPTQLLIKAEKLGFKLGQYVGKSLILKHELPFSMRLDEHTQEIFDIVTKYNIKRFMIDGVREYEELIKDKIKLREHIHNITYFMQMHHVTSLLTAEMPKITGELQLTENGISAMSDITILLKFVEIGSVVKKAIHVLKVRGAKQDPTIRELKITSKGISIGKPFKGVQGILTGNITRTDIKMGEFLG